MPESSNNDIRWLSEYLGSVDDINDSGERYDLHEYGRVVEYKNILSFDAIYFRPLIEMFHDLISFTVLLYED